jgi:hypothetical protein
MTFVKGDPKAKAGRARMQEIARENANLIAHTVRELLAPLGGLATQSDLIDAEMIASLWVRARRARAEGKSDVALIRMAASLMRDASFRQQPPLHERTIEWAASQHRTLDAEPGHFEIQGAATFELGKVDSQK